jgi:peptide/nickel transport system ATP-binding protein
VTAPPGTPGSAPESLLRIEDLRVRFATQRGPVHAVSGVSLEIRADEVLAVVGESGSGKTLTGLSVLGLEPPGATVTGHVWFRGEDLRTAPRRRLQDVRGAGIGMVFQEPMTSLNPSLTVGRQVAEVLRRHQGLSGKQAKKRAAELLALVRMPDPVRQLGAYPHQLSGGMRQRAVIAMAIACNPALLIADEPTTALDPTIQAQILALLRDLRASLRMSVLLITHNLGLVSGFADRVLVMYAGHVLEESPARSLFASPGHPYTAGLLNALPRHGSNRRSGRLTPIPGQVPVLHAEAESCVFAPRCPHVREECRAAQPMLRPVRGSSHRAACVLEASQITGQAGDAREVTTSEITTEVTDP